MSSSVLVLRPKSTNANASSLSQVNREGHLTTHVPTHSPGTLLDMNVALNCLTPDLQKQVLKRFFDDVHSFRRSAPLAGQTALCTSFTQEMKSTLNILPPEIRVKIYKLVFPEEWEGKVPILIKALRPVRKLHDEAAVEFFTSHKVFKLHKANGWSFADMSDKALLSIRRIAIMLEEGHDDPRLPNNPGPNVHYLQSVFLKCKKVRHVAIRVPWGRNGFWPLLPEDYITQFLVGFQHLYRVQFKIPNTYMTQQVFGYLRPGSARCIIEHANKHLGTCATTRDVSITPELPMSVCTTTLYRGREENADRQAFIFPYLEDEDREGWVRYQPYAKMTMWQWRPSDDNYLKEVKET